MRFSSGHPATPISTLPNRLARSAARLIRPLLAGSKSTVTMIAARVMPRFLRVLDRSPRPSAAGRSQSVQQCLLPAIERCVKSFVWLAKDFDGFEQRSQALLHLSEMNWSGRYCFLSAGRRYDFLCLTGRSLQFIE